MSERGDTTDALFEIADGLKSIARALRDLGTGNASTSMGAIEYLASELRDGLSNVALSLSAKD